ncbi:MAG: thioredoxin family protein [Candidatus Micrarchaeia archaeon]
MRTDIALLSAFTIILIAVVGVSVIFGEAQKQAPAQSPSLQAFVPTENIKVQNATAKTTTEVLQVDFLYADWCEYCTQAKPQMVAIASELSPNVKLNLWNEKDRNTSVKTAAIYLEYKRKGLFGGFPTIVANGEKGESSLLGMKSKQEIKNWLCSQFEHSPNTCD